MTIFFYSSFYASKRIIKEPITSDSSYSYLSLSLSSRFFRLFINIHHAYSFHNTLIFYYFSLFIYFFFVIVLYFQILAYNKEKKNFIHLFIHRTSSQRLNINNFHSDMIFSPIPARKCIEMSANSKNDHNN